MFGTLLLKEMHEVVITGKFLIVSLLCIILIPLGMYVSLKEYEQRNADYLNAERLYEERSEGNVGASFRAEGYRPPSPLSIFAFGLEPYIPNKAATSNGRSIFSKTMDGVVAVTNESTLRNPLSVLYGKMDYLSNVAFVLTLFAFVFTFAGITSEREQGTLKLIIANNVSRWSLLTAKIVGNFVVFLLPFSVAFIAGILLLILSGVFPVNEYGVASAMTGVFAISVLFLLCMFILGTLVSSWNRNSIAAIITLLSIWVLFAIVIPKLSPMVAQVVKPVEAQQVNDSRIQTARSDIKDEQLAREEALFVEVVGRHGASLEEYNRMDNGSPEKTAIESDYDQVIAPIREEYAEKILQATTSLQREYDNELHAQESIALLFTRISPMCCFTNILTTITGTGIEEIRNFQNHADLFQQQVTRSVYDNYRYRQYGSGMLSLGFYADPDADVNNIPVPTMTGYRRATLAEAFGESWPDLLLLALYTVVFFAGAFVMFLRYDVR